MFWHWALPEPLSNFANHVEIIFVECNSRIRTTFFSLLLLFLCTNKQKNLTAFLIWETTLVCIFMFFSALPYCSAYLKNTGVYIWSWAWTIYSLQKSTLNYIAFILNQFKAVWSDKTKYFVNPKSCNSLLSRWFHNFS